MQRVRDPERFERELSAPLTVGAVVNEAELEADASSFIAFAAAMGVAAPPPAEIPSSSSAEG